VSKISELSDGGSLLASDYLLVVRSGGNVKVRMDQINVDQVDLGDNEFIRLGNSQDLTMVHTSTQSIINQAGIGDLLLQKAGTTKASITANGLEFPDNSKAIFGAGSDLQIGHDGSVSFITDSGTGDLYIQGSSAIRLTNPAGNETFAVFNDNGAASLYYDNGVSLSTAATGIDVTGSVTADGLTVDGQGTITKAVADQLTLAYNASNSTSYGYFSIVNNNIGNEFSIHTGGSKSLNLDANGDISFYNTGGTSQSLFWDASAESLGIGTTSLTTSDGSNVELSAATSSRVILASTGTGGRKWAMATGTTGSLDFYDYDASAYRMRIDASGNVSIGTSNSLGVLTIKAPASDDQDIITITEDGINQAFSINGNFAGSGSTGNAITLDSYWVDDIISFSGDGSVGIGTSTPSDTYNYGKALDLQSSTGAAIYLRDSDNTNNFGFISYDGGENRCVIGGGGTAYLRLISAGAECGRFDTSGNLLVGKTATSFSLAGIGLMANDQILATAASDNPLALNRLTTDGDIARFYKDSALVGSIGTINSALYIGTLSENSGITFQGTALQPTNGAQNRVDNTNDIGSGTYRWDDIYATNGTIQTSDRNEKQDIEELSDAEQRVAVAAKGLLRKFRWKSSVAEKGDEARTHFGIIAQDLQAAFEAEGLDAGRYAMFINSAWTDEETGEERSRMGVRYHELLAFIIAAI